MLIWGLFSFNGRPVFFTEVDRVGFKFRYVCYAAIFCGLALGTKYNGLVVLCVLGLLLPVLGVRTNSAHRTVPPTLALRRRRTATIALHWIMFGALSLLVFSPWMIRNYVWVGNPLHPLYQSAFKSLRHAIEEDDGNQNLSPEVRDRKSVKKANHFIIRRQIYNESGPDILLIPLRIFFQGQDDNPNTSTAD